MSEARVFALVRAWESILPIDRGERYEDPLMERLGDRGTVHGGGTQLKEGGRIEHIDIELELDDDDEVFGEVMGFLSQCGMPKRSELIVPRGEEELVYSFGVAEGVEIELASVPETEVFDALIEAIEEAAGEELDLRGPHVLKEGKLAFYVYSLDAEATWSTLAPVLEAHPLGRGAVVTVRCGHPDGEPRTVTVPS
ncbi:MAG: hypothetical protein AB7S26_06175 [Sandaracinaceae bacterium]